MRFSAKVEGDGNSRLGGFSQGFVSCLTPGFPIRVSGPGSFSTSAPAPSSKRSRVPPGSGEGMIDAAAGSPVSERICPPARRRSGQPFRRANRFRRVLTRTALLTARAAAAAIDIARPSSFAFLRSRARTAVSIADSLVGRFISLNSGLSLTAVCGRTNKCCSASY